MIPCFSPTIRRREMEAALSCMVDDSVSPGEMNLRLCMSACETAGFQTAVAVRSPAVALEHSLSVCGLHRGDAVVMSALAPAYYAQAAERLGFSVLAADVDESTGCASLESVKEQIKAGGRLLLLAEPFCPPAEDFGGLGVTVIEDISRSFALPTQEEGSESAAALSIMGMEDGDLLATGGGALLASYSKQGKSVLKSLADDLDQTDLLPDLNAALGYCGFKEFKRNQASRVELYEYFSRTLASSRHKVFAMGGRGNPSSCCCFAVEINCGFREVHSHAQKRGVEVKLAFAGSLVAKRRDELSLSCPVASSLSLRVVLFPLYPRLSKTEAQQVAGVLSSLP